ncbi:TSC22 domain family protein 1-like [Acipenser oxyrinchus oxyrinchus]|uniref:TSC22 domain family protein 1-like n=1 Tax=Acipenser oxyrinchus oxyrinchus TaxID=40147 RepID=A0AAD8FRT5_ACIOX|nr:TSC22 domain family protein 1-like [Acipenser oxyrinchus oxyrinchus]
MSSGKKKSGFQITSVTSEFEQKNGTGELTRNDNLSPESNGPTMLLTPKLESTNPLNNRYAGGPASRSASPCPVATATPDPSIATDAPGSPQNRGAPLRTDRDGAGNSGQAEDSAAAGPKTPGLLKTPQNETPTAGGYNGSASPSLLCPRFAGKTLPCFSAPNTPTQARRGQPALPAVSNEEAAASTPSSPSGTLPLPLALPLTSPPGCRFRLVKLDPGLREPYKRGRWTCVDFYDRDSENQAVSKILDSMRHAHSLESLEGLGLASSAAGSKRNHKPLFMTPTPNQHHLVHSQGTTHVLAPNLAAPPNNSCSPPKTRQQQQQQESPGAPASKPHPATPSRAPQNITPPRSPKEAASRGLWSPPTCLRSPVSLSLAEELINSTESKNVDQAERGRKSARMDSGSRSGSPAPPLLSAGSPGRRSLECRIHSPACFSFAQSMFGVGTSFDIDDEGGSGSSTVAIDNKIEQAMDLVKSHLMFAVREEVEVLKEQIKELAERNSVLERENSLLRAIASPEQLNQLRGERGATIASPEQLNQLQGERGATIASPEQLNQLQGERGATIASPDRLNQLRGERGATIASPEQLNQLQGEREATIASPEQLNQLRGERGATIASPEQLNQLQGERGAETPRDSPKSNGNTTSNNNNNHNNNNHNIDSSSSNSSTSPLV